MKELTIAILLIALLCSHQECNGLQDLAVKKQKEVLTQKAGARALNGEINKQKAGKRALESIISDMILERDGVRSD